MNEIYLWIIHRHNSRWMSYITCTLCDWPIRDIVPVTVEIVDWSIGWPLVAFSWPVEGNMFCEVSFGSGREGGVGIVVRIPVLPKRLMRSLDNLYVIEKICHERFHKIFEIRSEYFYYIYNKSNSKIINLSRINKRLIIADNWVN